MGVHEAIRSAEYEAKYTSERNYELLMGIYNAALKREFYSLSAPNQASAV